MEDSCARRQNHARRLRDAVYIVGLALVLPARLISRRLRSAGAFTNSRSLKHLTVSTCGFSSLKVRRMRTSALKRSPALIAVDVDPVAAVVGDDGHRLGRGDIGLTSG